MSKRWVLIANGTRVGPFYYRFWAWVMAVIIARELVRAGKPTNIKVSPVEPELCPKQLEALWQRCPHHGPKCEGNKCCCQKHHNLNIADPRETA